MSNIILKGDDFAGITSEERRAVYEAEAQADVLNISPDIKKAILNRWRQRLARHGAGFRLDETVVRVDQNGIARIIPKEQATGWIAGLPAHRDTRDASSAGARSGRARPYRQNVAFSDPGPIVPVDPRTAAQNFHFRIRQAMEKTGTIPSALRDELWREGWRLGQPVPLNKVEEWCARFVNESNKRVGGR